MGLLQKLKVLDLSNNGFQGILPSSLGNLTELIKLNVGFNRFNGRIPKELSSLKKLEFLDLSNNCFSPFGVPLFLSEMVRLKEVYLSRNKLGGQIPEIWEKLGGILGLGLSGLGLVEEIPSSMGVYLRNVCYLGLDNIELEGEVHEEFTVYTAGEELISRTIDAYIRRSKDSRSTKNSFTTVDCQPSGLARVADWCPTLSQVGGLGDVVTSLSRAVQDLGHNVDIILPKYDCMNLSNVKDFQFHRSYSWDRTEVKVWTGKVEGLSVYFLEPQNGLFWKGCIYGCKNDAERFGFFCHAALEFLLQSGLHPDILHCHDWSSAPVSWLFKDHYMHYGLSKVRVVFTIHNLEFGAQLIGKAMAYSDKATTVSHTYSKEVSKNPIIAPQLHKFHGILNGIDPDIWDPYNDKFIPIPYSSENVVEGKRAAKEALQQRLGLKKSDLPLVGIITRLTVQKGIHLIKHAIWRTLERNGQVVLLGSAPDPRIQSEFVNLANQLHSSHNDRARLILTYDEPLSHLIYAGADFILVPSIFEPCGLTQLTAMRFGSIPVVRKTGGLYDTVFDVDHDGGRAQEQGLEPNGFSFDGADPPGVDYALNRAISMWYDERDRFNFLCKRAMEQDWSWNRPALDYMELYHACHK
ncbi:hypothetical protein GIB67_011531 [Kingdonia uniflora]|uniref:starch synthase n=1 Tax=Kingdonia uniflora TaxID=39325 RepID=A0A7J7NLZ2_9MAGN|nr:hypothetical protein GIB67_011531 [Kingdonia uniflora]